MEFLHLLENIRTPFLNSFFLTVTELGDETVAIALLCFIYWCINKETAIRSAITYFISGLFTHGIKITARVERPWVLDKTLTPLEQAVGTTGGSFSFPSGHTQSVTGLFFPLTLASKRRWAKALYLVIIFLVAFSRLYFGVHTPQDVLVGFGLTVCIALFVNLYFEKLNKNYVATGVVLGFFALAVGVYSLVLYKADILTLHTTESICKAVGAGMGFALGWIFEKRFVNFNTKCNAMWKQAVKYIVGMGITVGLKSGLKVIIGDSLVADTFRYLLIVLFAIGIYPLLIKKFVKEK